MPSVKVLEKKKQKVEQLVQKMKNAKSIVFADYRGLTVEQDTELRVALRNAGVDYSVVKNSLTRFALKENGIESATENVKGPISMAISNDDVVAPAKVLNEFAEKYKELELKFGILEGKLIDAKEVEQIAKLPSKEELVARVLSGLNSPLYGFVSVLNANLRGLVVALNAVAEKKAEAQ